MDAQERIGFQGQLLDITHEAVIACDVRERIIYWNAGAERTYGWAEHEVLGKPAGELLQPVADEAGAIDKEQRLEALRRGETLSGEYSTRRKDGAIVEIAFNARAIRDSEGGLQGYVTVHRDVTERRRSERAVRESEARLRALIEASPLGIDIMDLQGNPIFYNPKCAELHGLELGDAFGEGWEQAVHPDDRERIATSWYAAARAGKAWSETYRLLHRDGKVVWVSGRAAPMYVDGQLVGFVGTLEDISTEREAREKAERATRHRDEMLAVVAHDLRNPLDTIGLTVQALLAGESASRPHRRPLQVIQRSVQTMERLIRDLLDVSRLEAGHFTVKRSRVDIAALCRDAVELFEAQARERGIALSCRIEPRMPTLHGDPLRLAQLLSNLLGNALKFTPAPGQVALRTERLEQAIHVAVEDSGPGIPPEELPHLFESFWQGEQASDSGTGLGLAISRGIVTAHGGRIWADSRPGEGTTVHFTLPGSREL